jgi:plastocyanin
MAQPLRRRRLTVWLMMLVACFWCTRGAAGGGQRPAVQTHTVSISGFKYQPDNLTVNLGDTVEWKNADIVPHTVTAVDKNFSSGNIAPGATWKLVTKKAGAFPYTCTPHPNMKAKLVVK